MNTIRWQVRCVMPLTGPDWRAGDAQLDSSWTSEQHRTQLHEYYVLYNKQIQGLTAPVTPAFWGFCFVSSAPNVMQGARASCFTTESLKSLEPLPNRPAGLSRKDIRKPHTVDL